LISAMLKINVDKPGDFRRLARKSLCTKSREVFFKASN